jgi:Arc/MetJ-type ribon-helix-helix transcriptional regulator
MEHRESDVVYEGQIADDSTPLNQAPADGGKIPSLNDLAASVKDVAQRTGDVINKATESIGKAIDSALAARDHVVMVRVNDESLRKIEALAESGIFKSRSEAAAFLISEGVKAQSDLFKRIEEKIDQIERLRSELKTIVDEQHPG